MVESLGVSPVCANLSPWPGGAYAAPADRGRVNRAELKLLEAIETFKLRIRAGGTALDLGTALLRRR